MLDRLTYKSQRRNKTAFYASDFGKSTLDLYFQFKGEEATNPPKWYDTLKWGAGNGVEASLLNILKENGIVEQDYDQKLHGKIDIEREGVSIHGYIDAKAKDGTPIEIKSINNANKFDIRKYENNLPRENYVGQLAVYIDALGLDRGRLLVCSIDGLHRFEFDCIRLGGRRFKCGETVVDLDKEYKRWANLWNDNVKKDTPPDIFQYRYKIPVDEINWKMLSKTDISKARNGQKVIGDWQIQYSDYKDKIVALQGSELGYSLEEIAKIKELTAGYTTW